MKQRDLKMPELGYGKSTYYKFGGRILTIRGMNDIQKYVCQPAQEKTSFSSLLNEHKHSPEKH